MLLKYGLWKNTLLSPSIVFGEVIHRYAFLDKPEVDDLVEQARLADTNDIIVAINAGKLVGERYRKQIGEKYDFVGREVVFDLECTDIRLRGKVDGIVRDSSGRYWIFELKTSGNPRLVAAESKLLWDLQTSYYSLLAYLCDIPISGVVYEWVSRPVFSSAKGSIRQRKTETASQLLDRLESKLDAEGVNVTCVAKTMLKEDIEKFVDQFLSPVCKQLASWYASDCRHYHWRSFKNYGDIWDEVDEFLQTGSQFGLVPVDLFSELKEDSHDVNNSQET